MVSSIVFALAASLPLVLTQTLTNETVLGVYMFHRHGDRTPKLLAPTNLTDLGFSEVYTSGQYYRSRYLEPTSDYRIQGINSDVVLQSQIQVSAPDDTVLQNSATGFLTGFYPPVGSTLDSQVLANGSTVVAPLDGFQLIPVELVSSGSGSEDATWLQSTSDCGAAAISSNQYYVSSAFNDSLASTTGFYQRIAPVMAGIYNTSQVTFTNAYSIFDYINVAEIHNQTITGSSLLNSSTLLQVTALANEHEFNLAYNASEPIRSISGKILAGQAVQFLNGTLADAGKHTGQKIGIQFGAYGSFTAFFALAGLLPVNVDFYGVTGYASSMVFEMFTNASTAVTTSNFPSTDDVYVRFAYYNGTATNSTPPVVYPLFGSGQDSLKWDDFVTGMNKFAIGDNEQWCVQCGNFTGTCAAYASSNSSSSGSGSASSSSTASKGNGLSPAVNGVIGAMVTLAVVLGLEALILLLGGLRVVSKKRLAGAGQNGVESPGSSTAQKA